LDFGNDTFLRFLSVSSFGSTRDFESNKHIQLIGSAHACDIVDEFLVPMVFFIRTAISANGLNNSGKFFTILLFGPFDFGDAAGFFLKAIAAMSLNRVIGRDGKIPWHIAEDFRWFKRTTVGKAVLMGRKTFASLGSPLPNRTNIVVTRGGPIPGVLTVSDPKHFDPAQFETDVFVIGGAEIYAQLLPRCAELYLSVVKREVEGDAFFPRFEDQFRLCEVMLTREEFEVRRYENISLSALPEPDHKVRVPDANK
jgi:dihydrofolate reductase